MTLFERTKETAKAQGLSLRELEKQAGLGDTAIYSWKKYTPRGSNLQKVADVLNVSVDYLLGNTDDKLALNWNKSFDKKLEKFINALNDWDTTIEERGTFNSITDLVAGDMQNKAYDVYTQILEITDHVTTERLEQGSATLLDKVDHLSSDPAKLGNELILFLTRQVKERNANKSKVATLNGQQVDLKEVFDEENIKQRNVSYGGQPISDHDMALIKAMLQQMVKEENPDEQ